MTDTAGLLPRLSARLGELSSHRQTVTYGALARDLGCRMGELTQALETLMEADTAAGHPLRAALCDARLTPGLPAPGFFEKAAALGYDLTAPVEFVRRQRHDLFERA